MQIADHSVAHEALARDNHTSKSYYLMVCGKEDKHLHMHFH